jgi:hypothetical protein
VIAVAVGAAVLDIVATYLAMRNGLGVERNPLAASLMNTIGVGPTLAAGLLLRILLVGLLGLIGVAASHLAARRAASVILVGVAMWWVLVTVNSVGVVVNTRV